MLSGYLIVRNWKVNMFGLKNFAQAPRLAEWKTEKVCANVCDFLLRIFNFARQMFFRGNEKTLAKLVLCTRREKSTIHIKKWATL